MNLRVILILVCFTAGGYQIVFSQTRSDSGKKPTDKEGGVRYTRLGQSYFESGNYSLALFNLDLAIGADSTSWQAYRWKGETELKLKHYESAIASYTHAINLNSTDTISFKGRAESFRLEVRIKEALADYSVALRWDPKDAQMLFGRALCYAYLGNNWSSIGDLNNCIRVYPSVRSFYSLRGKVYLNLDLYRNALGDLNKAISLGGKTEENDYYRRAFAFAHLKKLDSAILDFKIHLATHENDILAYKGLGLAYAQKGDSTECDRWFQMALLLKSVDSDINLSWANAAIQSMRFQKADEVLKTELAIGHKSSRLYNLLAAAKVGLNDTLSAIEYWKQALHFDSLNTEVYQTRMRALIGSWRYSDITLDDLSKLITHSKDSFNIARAYAYRGLLNFSMKDTLNSIVDTRNAITFAPREPFSYIFSVYCSILRDPNCSQPEPLLADLDKAIRLTDKLAEPYYLKAIIYSAMRKKSMACRNIKLAITKGLFLSESIEYQFCKGKPKKGLSGDFSVSIEFPTERTD